MLIIASMTILIILVFYRKQKALKEELKAQAQTDELTGAANRRHILNIAKQQFDSAQRYKYSLTIGIIDLDYFKQVNDTYGHDVGDLVLREFANVCENNLREQDFFGRYGGEEWLLVFPHTQFSDTEIILNRIRSSLENTDFPMESPPTFSAGLTQINEQDITLKDLVKRADDALYIAKEQGRNRNIYA